MSSPSQLTLSISVFNGATCALQTLTRKKALGAGPGCALQAEYALGGSILVTVLQVCDPTKYTH